MMRKVPFSCWVFMGIINFDYETFLQVGVDGLLVFLCHLGVSLQSLEKAVELLHGKPSIVWQLLSTFPKHSNFVVSIGQAGCWRFQDAESFLVVCWEAALVSWNPFGVHFYPFNYVAKQCIVCREVDCVDVVGCRCIVSSTERPSKWRFRSNRHILFWMDYFWRCHEFGEIASNDDSDFFRGQCGYPNVLKRLVPLADGVDEFRVELGKVPIHYDVDVI